MTHRFLCEPRTALSILSVTSPYKRERLNNQWMLYWETRRYVCYLLGNDSLFEADGRIASVDTFVLDKCRTVKKVQKYKDDFDVCYNSFAVTFQLLSENYYIIRCSKRM